jgi:LysM repeat protein
MFEQKKLSSSTLFKTIIFAGVLCLLIIYRGNSNTETPQKVASATSEQTTNSNIRKIEITAEASQKSLEPLEEIKTTQLENAEKPTSIGDLITGSIETDTATLEKPSRSISEIATESDNQIAVTTPTLNEDQQQISASTVTVKSGDTLYSISRKSGVSVAALTNANGIKNNVIRVGQVLNIPR